jgi:cystathionine beta-lyase family protein involved in aluminum resistance
LLYKFSITIIHKDNDIGVLIGGYIAGRKDLIERCGYRLTAPGIGKEAGASLYSIKSAPTSIGSRCSTNSP